MGGLFTLAGALFFVAAFAFVAGIQAMRARDWHGALPCFVVIPRLLIAMSAAAWVGIRFPGVNFWNNQGFGADWECRGRGFGNACFRDLPAGFRGKPATPEPTRSDLSH